MNFRTGLPVSPITLAAMSDRLQHRGPDGDGVWADGAVGFGHRRLAIIDLTSAGQQPMHSADGRLTITFNGEIYNFEAVRRELEARGRTFRSRTDTEVILQAYDEFGIDCLEKLRGMFAFAIWDGPRRRLFAARDRVGKKPLYYRQDADGLAFASEPKAFQAESSFVPEADPTALAHYLSFQYVPTPSSAFRGLARLPAAHYLLLEAGRLTIERYWTLRFGPKYRDSEREAADSVLEALRTATRLRMISDVPLGAFLSGGVDSSVVVALMTEAASRPVKTFSIGFDDGAYNELPFARQVAERFGTEHHEAVVRPDAVAILPKMIWHYNEPFADSSAVPTFYLAQMTRQHVTVALNGDGGDESFAGYDRYLASRLASRIEHVPMGLRAALAKAARAVRSGPSRTGRARLLRFLAGAADSQQRRYARWMFHFGGEAKQALCTPEFLASAGPDDSEALLEAMFTDVDGEGLIDTLLSVDVRSYLVDDLLVKVDIATMASSLEGRSPLLDHVVMERAARLPERFKLRGRHKKFLLREIARRYLPDAIIDRPKMGFGVPLDRWFREELRPLAHDVLLSSRLRSRGYFNPGVIERMLLEHDRGSRSWHYQLWNLLVFEMWHRTFIDGGGARA